MNARDSIWSAAGQAGIAPIGLDGLPPAVLERLRSWLRVPLQRGCPHTGTQYALLGAQVVRCAECAEGAGFDALASRCGGCGDETGDDGVQGLFALTPELIAAVASCAACLNERTEEPMSDPRERLERVRVARATLDSARQRHETERARREAERKRRAELIPAPCRVCGAMVAQGEGERLPAPPADRHGDCWSVVHEQWVPAPKDADRWRRAHDSCATLDRAGIVHVLTGVLLATEQALHVETPVPQASAWPWNRTSDRPWGFVADTEREALRAAAKLAQAAGRSILCSDGACGCCGVRYSASWFASDLRWADGSPTPVCSECDPVWSRWGGANPHASREERQRAATLELLTGWKLPMGLSLPEGLQPYARSSDGDVVGHPEPFAWSPQLEALRVEVWTARPDLAPEDRREEFRAIHDGLVAAERARRRAEAERETVTAW